MPKLSIRQVTWLVVGTCCIATLLAPNIWMSLGATLLGILAISQGDL